jgi:hypothetical protein
MLEPSEGIANLADATFFYYLILEKLLPKVLGLNLLDVVFWKTFSLVNFHVNKFCIIWLNHRPKAS